MLLLLHFYSHTTCYSCRGSTFLHLAIPCQCLHVSIFGSSFNHLLFYMCVNIWAYTPVWLAHTRRSGKNQAQGICFETSWLEMQRLVLLNIRENGGNMAKMWILFRSIDSWARRLGGPWTGWIGSVPVQMSGCCLGAALSWLRDGLLWGLVVPHWPFVSPWTVTLFILGLRLEVLRAHLLGLCCTAAFPLQTVLGCVGKRGWGVEGYWCLQKWVQWSPSIGGAKCGLITSNERDVQGSLRLHQLLARLLPRRRSRRACVRAYVHFVCVCVQMCMCVCVWLGISASACGRCHASTCVFVCICMHMHMCDWLMSPVITCTSNLVPLLEGLCSSNPCRFEFSIFWVFAGIEPTTSGLTVPRSDQLS